MKEPRKCDFGYQEYSIGEESGWMLEGGEEAYYKALQDYGREKQMNSRLEIKYFYCQIEIEEDGKCPFQCDHCIKYYDNLENSKEIL